MSASPVCINRWPAQKTDEQPKAFMSCKSCRDIKVKCDRLRPSCTACQRLSYPCVYDGVRKKRGPKTDSIGVLLRRVDGLEKRLRGENAKYHDTDLPSSSSSTTWSSRSKVAKEYTRPASLSCLFKEKHAEILVDTYFERINGKPFHILDEASTRNDLKNKILPRHLCLAMFAASARCTKAFGSREVALCKAIDYAKQARAELNIDEPSIEGVRTLLMLSQIMLQEGKSRKSYMYLGSAIAMAFALNLNREYPTSIRVSPAERESRRRLFWTCYAMDRFGSCGSGRPCLISDEDIVLELPSNSDDSSTDDPLKQFSLAELHFPLLCQDGGSEARTGSDAMLIKITRILGCAHDYLAAGGYHGDLRRPWHPTSRFTRIMSDLDDWSADMQNVFLSIDSMFERTDSIILLLCKLIYHLIYCLMYRLGLPVRLAELEPKSQQQRWQAEISHLCCKHANAITELVGLAGMSGIRQADWPVFVSYCVFTAGTVHVHGIHFATKEGEASASAAQYLAQDVRHLDESSTMWASVRHQRDTLQSLRGAHPKLVDALSSNTSYSLPIFEMGDFFDRYPGMDIDGSHIALGDMLGSSQNWMTQQPVDEIQRTLLPSTLPPLSPEQWTSNQIARDIVTPSATDSSHCSPPDLFYESLDGTSSYQSMVASPSVPTPQSFECNFWDLQLPNSGLTDLSQSEVNRELGLDFWATGAAQTYSLPQGDYDWSTSKSDGPGFVSQTMVEM